MLKRDFMKLILLGGIFGLGKKSAEAATWTEALPSASATNISAAINGAAVKTPIDADIIGICDSAASFSLKKLTFATLKSFLFSSPTLTGTTTATTVKATTVNATTFNGSLNGNVFGAAGNNIIATCNSNNSIASFAGESLSVRGNGAGAAAIAFHRPGVYAAFLGIDTDNKLKYGGWSAGAVAYPVFTKANCSLSGTTLTITI